LPITTNDSTCTRTQGIHINAHHILATSIFIVFDEKKLILIAWRHYALADDYSSFNLRDNIRFTSTNSIARCILYVVVAVGLVLYCETYRRHNKCEALQRELSIFPAAVSLP